MGAPARAECLTFTRAYVRTYVRLTRIRTYVAVVVAVVVACACFVWVTRTGKTSTYVRTYVGVTTYVGREG